MKVKIGKYDAASRSVAVTFEAGELRHARAVNACLDATGGYDAGATAARVDEVARGVAEKIAVGAITPSASPRERSEVAAPSLDGGTS